MFDVGRMCVKIAGRDAGKQCTVVDVIDDYHVLVDGETRRRKVNVKHLEPLQRKIEIEKNASHDEVKAAFEAFGIKIVDTKPRQKPARLKKVRKKKVKTIKAKPSKKAPKAEKKMPTLEATVEPAQK